MKIRPGQIAMPDFNKDEIREIIYGVEEAHHNLIDVGDKAAILKIKLNFEIIKTPALNKFATVKSIIRIFSLIDPTCRLVIVDESGYVFGSEMKINEIQEDNWLNYVKEKNSPSFKIEIDVKARVKIFGKYLYTWLKNSNKHKCKTEVISIGETSDVCWLQFADPETHNMETMKDYVANILGDIPFHLQLGQDPIVVPAIFVEVKDDDFPEAKHKLCESGKVFLGLYRNIVPIPAYMNKRESAESPFWMHFFFMKKKGPTVIDYKEEDEDQVMELLKKMLNERVEEKKYICTAVDIYEGTATLAGPGEFCGRVRNLIPQYAMSLGIDVTVRKGNKDFIDTEGHFYESKENSIREYNILEKPEKTKKKKKSKENKNPEANSEAETEETVEKESSTIQTEEEEGENIQEELEQECQVNNNNNDNAIYEDKPTKNQPDTHSETPNKKNDRNDKDETQDETQEKEDQTTLVEETEEQNTNEKTNGKSEIENLERPNQSGNKEDQRTIQMAEIKAMFKGNNNKIYKRIDEVENKLDDHIKETDEKHKVIQEQMDEFRRLNTVIQDDTKVIKEKSKELEQELALNNMNLSDKIQQIQMDTSEATNQLKTEVHRNFQLQMRHQQEYRESSQNMKQEILKETVNNIKSTSEESKACIENQTENIKSFMTRLLNSKSDDDSVPILNTIFTKKDNPGQVTPQKQRKIRDDDSTSSTMKSITLSSTSTSTAAKRKRAATRSMTQKRKKTSGKGKETINLVDETGESTESEDESFSKDLEKEAAKVTPKKRGRPRKDAQNSSQAKHKATKKNKGETQQEDENSDYDLIFDELLEKPVKETPKRGRPRKVKGNTSQTKIKVIKKTKEEIQQESMEAAEQIKRHKDLFKNLKKKKMAEAKQRRKNEVTQESDSDSYDGYEDIDERIAIKKQKKIKYPSNGKHIEEEPDEEYTTDDKVVWDEEHTNAKQTTLTRKGQKFRNLTKKKGDTHNSEDGYTNIQE